jgi:hypothetical protein
MQGGAQISLITSFGSLSSRNPRKLGTLILPSEVHSRNATSQTSLGFTHWTGALAFGFGVNGHVGKIWFAGIDEESVIS